MVTIRHLVLQADFAGPPLRIANEYRSEEWPVKLGSDLRNDVEVWNEAFGALMANYMDHDEAECVQKTVELNQIGLGLAVRIQTDLGCGFDVKYVPERCR